MIDVTSTPGWRQPLQDHAAAKGDEVRMKHGPHIGWRQLLAILNDRTLVRYPCELSFTSAGLLPGEAAHPVPLGDRPEQGFVLHVHPVFQMQIDRVPHLVLYQLVLVNYGEFASSDDAEAFGAAALGLERDSYYEILCELADTVSQDPPPKGSDWLSESLDAGADVPFPPCPGACAGAGYSLNSTLPPGQ